MLGGTKSFRFFFRVINRDQQGLVALAILLTQVTTYLRFLEKRNL